MCSEAWATLLELLLVPFNCAVASHRSMGLDVTFFFVQLRNPKWLSRVQLRYEQAGFLLDLRECPFTVSLVVFPSSSGSIESQLLLLQSFWATRETYPFVQSPFNHVGD